VAPASATSSRHRPLAATPTGRWAGRHQRRAARAPCSESEAALPDGERPAGCDVALANAASVNWSLHSDDDAWFLRGQLTGSQRLGGPPSKVLATARC